jgi:hypothetical protein
MFSGDSIQGATTDMFPQVSDDFRTCFAFQAEQTC